MLVIVTAALCAQLSESQTTEKDFPTLPFVGIEVRDLTNNPVPNARIRWLPMYGMDVWGSRALLDYPVWDSDTYKSYQSVQVATPQACFTDLLGRGRAGPLQNYYEYLVCVDAPGYTRASLVVRKPECISRTVRLDRSEPVRVQVVDEKNQPVAGLAIDCEVEEPHGVLPSLYEPVLSYRVVTDAAGKASFEHVPHAKSVRCSPVYGSTPGYVSHKVITTDERRFRIEIVRGSPITGEVKYEDGTPVKGAEINSWNTSLEQNTQTNPFAISHTYFQDFRSRNFSNATGKFNIPGIEIGSWTYVTAIVHGSLCIGTGWSQTRNNIQVTIPQHYPVIGRFRPHKDWDFHQSKLEVRLSSSYRTSWKERFNFINATREIDMDQDGRFSFWAPKGVHRLRLRQKRGPWYSETLIRVQGALDCGERSLPVSTTVGLRAEDRLSRKTLFSYDCFHIENELRMPKPDPETGVAQWDQSASESHKYFIHAPGYLPQVVALSSPNKSNKIDTVVSLIPGSTIVCKVLDTRGKPAANVILKLDVQDKNNIHEAHAAWRERHFLNRTERHTMSDVNGVAVFPEIPPGDYRIFSVGFGSTRPYHRDTTSAPLLAFRLEPLEQKEICVHLEKLGELRVQCTQDGEPFPYASIGLIKLRESSPARPSMSKIGCADASGVFRLSALVPGKYLVGIRPYSPDDPSLPLDCCWSSRMVEIRPGIQEISIPCQIEEH